MGETTTKTFAMRDADISFVSLDVHEEPSRAAVLQALSECDNAVGLRNVVRQTFFVPQQSRLEELSAAVKEAYSGSPPVTNYVFQPPAEGAGISVEIWAFSAGADVRQHEHFTLATIKGATWGFAGGLATTQDEPVYQGVSRILNEEQREFSLAGMEFGQIVRTWYYIGNLLEPDQAGSRYSSFNKARNEFYHSIWSDLCHSPASTGIGMLTDTIALEALALDSSADDFRVVFIDNPRQTRPYLYTTETNSSRKPSFSRGAVVVGSDSAIVFISGTASIVGSDVVCIGDPEGQARVTIENIEILMGEKNLTGNYGLPGGATLDDLHQFRVYVKKPEYLSVVMDYCARHLPDVPRTYLVADVCRDGWLVEIEGVAAFRLSDA